MLPPVQRIDFAKNLLIVPPCFCLVLPPLNPKSNTKQATYNLYNIILFLLGLRTYLHFCLAVGCTITMTQIARALLVLLVLLGLTAASLGSFDHLNADDGKIDPHSDGLDRHRELFHNRRSRSSRSASKRRFRNRLSIDPVIRERGPTRFGPGVVERNDSPVDIEGRNPFSDRRRSPKRKMAKNYYQYGYYYAYSCDSKYDIYDSSSDSYNNYYDNYYNNYCK